MSMDMRKLISLVESMKSPELNKQFWEWFGISVVVDSSGNPLPVYHGTTSHFETFDLSLAGSYGEKFAHAAFFSSEPEVAGGYAVRWSSDDDFVTARKNEDDAYSVWMHTALEFGSKSEQSKIAEKEAKRLGKIRDDIGNRLDNFQSVTNNAHIMPVFLKIRHPLIVDADGENFRNVYQKAFSKAQIYAHDGIIIKNVIDAATTATQRPSDIFAVFHAGQIKSVYNQGTWSEWDNNIMV